MVLPGRNPVLLAKELASLDVLSGGRLLPAFGLGVARPPRAAGLRGGAGERAPWFDEALPLIRRLWTEERWTTTGARFHYGRSRVLPKPVQQPPDVWLGGHRAERAAPGRPAGDGWLPSSAPRRIAAAEARVVVEEAAGAPAGDRSRALRRVAVLRQDGRPGAAGTADLDPSSGTRPRRRCSARMGQPPAEHRAIRRRRLLEIRAGAGRRARELGSGSWPKRPAKCCRCRARGGSGVAPDGPPLPFGADNSDGARLVAEAAHELRAPIAALLAAAETLDGRWEQLTDDDRRRLAGVVLSHGRQLSDLVVELLDQSRQAAAGAAGRARILAVAPGSAPPSRRPQYREWWSPALRNRRSPWSPTIFGGCWSTCW